MQDEEEVKKKEREESENSQLLDQLFNRFGDIHHITMPRDELQMDPDWIHGCLAKLFIHSRLYQVKTRPSIHTECWSRSTVYIKAPGTASICFADLKFVWVSVLKIPFLSRC